MKIAIGQIAVNREWQKNQRTCVDVMQTAAGSGARLLVLPEGVLARDIADPDLVLSAAQPLDGPFLSALLDASRSNDMTTMLTIHISTGTKRVKNVLVAIRTGKVIAKYEKLHLYDAFSMQESVGVAPGNEVPSLVEIDEMRFGMMTCYDIRFPELARKLALDGADALVLPAAWVRGPLKEWHWEVLTTARALDNTCYVIASGECGPRNIGASVVVDPLGVSIVRAGETEALIFAEIDPKRIAYARSILPVLSNRRFAAPELIINELQAVNPE
ncbi:hydrolase [Burkholderia sp. Leaf177]|uniref:deaminated glutathione amidase n=1 Tax=Burkholderia sp. Leaf177 TaxID=1736287 RepID=UPI0006FAFBAA|nr:deaminated glutathione amidase [Burkholderia sp. Leaf177]KQR77130.1 hydrolase [Burkholderia sp. Leaf177]